MEAEKIKVHIDAVQRELLEKYHLTQHSFDGLAQYYRYRFQDRWETDKVAHYHFLISANDEESNLALFLDLYRSFNLLQKNFFCIHLKKYTEAEILVNPNLILKRGKNDFVLISNCKEGPLTKEDYQAWENVQTVLNDPQAPTCFLLASPDVFKQKFQNTPLYVKLYHQTFRYHIEPKRDYSVEDYLNELDCFLDREFPGITRTASFKEELDKYLSYVLANNPTYHGIDFLEDLKKRIVLEYYSLDQVDVIDERCVPYYNRERAAAMAEKAESETADEAAAETSAAEKNEETEPAAPAPEPAAEAPQPVTEVALTLPTCGDFFDIQPDAPEDSDVKNVLLLTLSTLNTTEFNKKSTFDLTDIPGEDLKEYYYQLEPVPYKLMLQFDQENQGQKLDGILMVCSTSTREDKKTGNVSKLIDPEANPADTFSATVLEYFKYKTADYAQKLNTPYTLSFKEIDTNIKAEERNVNKRTMDTLSLVHDVIEEIRILKQHYPNLNIHVDTHGGFRTTQEILNGVLSLLQMEGVTIKPANIHTVELSENKNPDNGATAFLASGGEIFNLMNFISGIHECINYGQIKSLHSLNDDCSPAGQQVLDDMQTIAEGIQLCDVDKFENGLNALSVSLPHLKGTETASKNDRYLALFHSLIHDSYGEALLNPERKAIDEIKWCLGKGFIQQALTLLESKMPAEIIKNGFLKSVTTNGCDRLLERTASGDTQIIESERTHLEEPGTPKFDYESVENYIFNRYIGSKNNRRLDLNSVYDYQSIAYYQGAPSFSVDGAPNRNSNNEGATSWESRRYCLKERGSADTTQYINALVQLHKKLKEARNSTNHAAEGENRLSVDTICRALNIYVECYERIYQNLHH